MADLLVVDDDDDIGDMLADILRELGHTVRVGRNGEQGLTLLEERLPDAVLLDVEMPALTGPQMAVRMFLHDVGQEEIPIVLQSGPRPRARRASSTTPGAPVSSQAARGRSKMNELPRPRALSTRMMP
jgi:CheY-like chemotaxis protein